MKCLSCILASAAVACGGVTTGPILDDGGSDATTDGPGSGGDSGTDAQPPADAGPDCNKLLADLEAKREAAVQCCATCDSLQCGTQVDGLCCPVTVTSATSQATKDYLAALAAVRTAQCSVNCPNIACSSQPSSVCQQDGTCKQ